MPVQNDQKSTIRNKKSENNDSDTNEDEWMVKKEIKFLVLNVF